MNLKVLLSINCLLANSLLADELSTRFEKLGAQDFTERENVQIQLANWAKLNPNLSVRRLLQEYKSSSVPEAKQRLLVLLENQVILSKFGKPSGFVGIEMQSAVKILNGQKLPVVRVSYVFPDSPADKYGLKLGDLIWRVDHKVFDHKQPADRQFSERIKGKSAGEKALISLYRGEESLELKLVLVERGGDLPEISPDHRVRQLKREKLAAQKSKREYFEGWLDANVDSRGIHGLR